MYSVYIPRVGKLTAETVNELADMAYNSVYESGYGASVTGARWVVKKDGVANCVLCYSGKIEELTK